MGYDKLYHVLVSAALAFSFTFVYNKHEALNITAAIGVAKECFDSLGYGSPEVGDFVADMVGIVIGLTFAVAVAIVIGMIRGTTDE
ncbi:TMhelix containing protein [Vibrio phage 2.275.O._10N.286.54.E11]|nr:TMhelix containing protein [Vibrio phage 2.275.O._10N.286.54.E11]